MTYWQFVSFGPPLETNTVKKSEHDEDEEDDKDFLDPGRELVMDYERDRNNIPICELVLATASDLKWDHFTRQSSNKINKKRLFMLQAHNFLHYQILLVMV